MRIEIVLVLLLSAALLLECCDAVHDDSDNEPSRFRRQTPRGRGRGRGRGPGRGRSPGRAMIISAVAADSPACVRSCLSERRCSGCVVRDCAALGK